MIVFSQRELVRAWNRLMVAAKDESRSNAHRLLLFYAAECGLKAAYLRRNNKDMLDGAIADELRHDINRVIDRLHAGAHLKLPAQMTLPPLRGKEGQTVARNCSSGDINQVWRYGGDLAQPSDVEIEEKLEKINQWIDKEIQ